MVMVIGALCFGISIGFITYRTLVRTVDNTGIGDIATVIAAVGGAAVTGLFDPSSDLFGWYAIGLLLGIATFFLVYWGMNGKDKTAKVMSGEMIGPDQLGPVGRGPRR